MRFRLPFLPAAILVLAATATPAISQSAHADIVNAQGATIGHADFSTVSGGVEVSVTVSQVAPGDHGIHIHNAGNAMAPPLPLREATSIPPALTTEYTTRRTRIHTSATCPTLSSQTRELARSLSLQ